MIGMILAARYLVEAPIGTGGMAEVYRALDLNTERIVAVKVLREEFCQDEEFVRRFHREAQAAAALTHENLVGVYDLGHEEGREFIVMEYVPGYTLKDRIREEKILSPEETVRIGLELCAALEHAHEEGIIHRDIKPQNIIVSPEGKVKLTDFGIARAATSSTMTSTDGTVMGSVHYFSPEQAKGELVGAQSDVYSLGVVLYEMATGKVPFNDETPVAIALAHLQQEPVPPEEIARMPRALSRVILKALRKQQAERYRSAAELAADLRRVLREPDGAYVKLAPPEAKATEEIPAEEETALSDEEITTVQPVPIEDAEDEVFVQGIQRRSEMREPRRHGKGALLVLGLVVLACLALVWMGLRVVSVMTDSDIPRVPDVQLMTFERAQETLRESGYTWIVEYAFSEEIGLGLVISQDPAPGLQLSSGGSVVLTISRGAQDVAMPDLLGMEEQAARQVILSSGLVVGEVIPQEDSQAERGTVIRQEPEAGAMLTNGDAVDIYISAPPVMREVPPLVGLPLTEALEKIGQAGMSVGEITHKPTTDTEPGLVLTQSPEVGETAVDGSEIDLWVSAEPVELFTKQLEIPLLLPDGDCQVRIYLEDAAGNRETLFDELTPGGEYTPKLNMERPAGTYRLVVMVNDEFLDSQEVTFGG